jgi:transketolase
MTTIFTKDMCNRLAELFEIEESIINPKHRTADANKKANQSWERIVDTLNAEFPATKVTLSQVHTKIKNIKKAAKKKSSDDRRFIY